MAPAWCRVLSRLKNIIMVKYGHTRYEALRNETRCNLRSKAWDWVMIECSVLRGPNRYVYQKLFVGRAGCRNYVHIPRSLFHI